MTVLADEDGTMEARQLVRLASADVEILMLARIGSARERVDKTDREEDTGGSERVETELQARQSCQQRRDAPRSLGARLRTTHAIRFVLGSPSGRVSSSHEARSTHVDEAVRDDFSAALDADIELESLIDIETLDEW